MGLAGSTTAATLFYRNAMHAAGFAKSQHKVVQSGCTCTVTASCKRERGLVLASVLHRAI